MQLRTPEDITRAPANLSNYQYSPSSLLPYSSRAGRGEVTLALFEGQHKLLCSGSHTII